MSQQTVDDGSHAGGTEDERVPITGRRLLIAMVGGAAGVVAMVPVLVGVPWVLNVFRVEPIESFAAIGEFLALDASVTVGIFLFAAGGVVILPTLFLVAGPFAPPERPKYLRAVTVATMFWPGFVFTFWPGGDTLTIGVFLVASLLAHWIYGAVLGTVVIRFTGLPYHDV
jgi:hypothetical protein